MAQTDEFLLQLRSANPIDTVMSSYVTLIKRGHNYVCACPFHSEKTPSCTVFMDTQSFYCFGCGAGGDVITFTMKIENLVFAEAIKLLAQRGGVTMPEFKGDNREAKRRTRIYEMNRLSANFFFLNLIKGNDKRGLKYLTSRGITPQTVKKYGLGYAPDSWNMLYDYLRSQGYYDDEIVDAWLCARSAKGRPYDIFRNRVMFPIVDMRGNVIGFGGRVLDDSKPKYLNTATTPVFDKGSNLYSMNLAKNSPEKKMILAEGYMDVIAVNQAGFDNVVATLGTAITANQAQLLSRYVNEIVIAYDSDGAGQAATQKAINHFSAVGVSTRIIRLEGAKDPDEYIKKFGSVRFKQLIEGSLDANNFILDKCEEGLDLNTEQGQVEYLNRAAKELAKIEKTIEREIYISRTAKKTNISVDVLKSHIDAQITKSRFGEKRTEWKNIQAAVNPIDKINPEARDYPKESKAEEIIIYHLMREPGDCEWLKEKISPDNFVTPFNKKVYSSLLGILNNSSFFTISMLADEFSPEELGKISGIGAKYHGMGHNRNSALDCINTLQKFNKISAVDPSFDDIQKALNSKRK